MGAAVLNSVSGSSDPAHDDHVRRTLVGVFRSSRSPARCSSRRASPSRSPAAGPCSWATGCDRFGARGGPDLPGPLLPDPAPGGGAAILTALGRNHVRILVQGLASPIFATTVGVLVLTGGRGGGYLAAFSYAGARLIAAVGSVIAFRSLPGLARGVLHDVWRSGRSAAHRSWRWPVPGWS